MSNQDEHSIHNEPHLKQKSFEADLSEYKADAVFEKERILNKPDDPIDHTVWDEPALSTQLAGNLPPDALNYQRWLAEKCASVTAGDRFKMKCFIILFTGPFSVLAVIFSAYGNSVSQIINAVIFAPVLEEPMKIGLLMWVVERKPYLIKNRLDITICALAGGFAFASIENVMYLTQPGVTPGLITWRLTVCTSLHVCCTLIASLGVMRIWKTTMETQQRPDMSLSFRYLVVAMITHGSYNALATYLSFSQYEF